MTPDADNRCPFCGGSYPRTYEEHTGSAKHRAKIAKRNRTTQRADALPQNVIEEAVHLASRRAPSSALDVDVLRAAIYAVSVRHDWEYTVDREDRTEEIAAEYDRLRGGSDDA